MLPLLPNHLLVSLSKNSVSMIYRGGLSKSMIGEKFVENQTQGNFDWQTLVELLDTAFAEIKLPAKTKLLITLSSDMVRYLTLPAQHINMRDDEKLQYANAAYKEIFGFVIENWVIKCHDAPPNQPILTSAIDFALYEKIQLLAKKYQFKLQSVQPYLMTVFNALQPSLKSSNALLAAIEPNRILLINIQQGYCQQVRSFLRASHSVTTYLEASTKINEALSIMSSNWQETLSQIMARETMIGDANVRELYIYAPLLEAPTLKLAGDWKIKLLKVNNKINIIKPAYAMLEAIL